MPDFLQQELAAAAFCWRLERRDGVAVGFTSHDRDLEADGLVYRAAPGMLPSAIGRSDGFEPDTLDVEGALTSTAITADDLAAGRWDGAAVSVFLVDWREPAGERLQVARGELGEISFKGQAFEAELRGPTAALERPAVEQTSPECRAELGDRRCRVDMAGRVHFRRVVASDGNRIEIDQPAANATYAFGRLRWLGGKNSGLAGAIESSIGVLLVLREAPHFPVVPGDLVEISEGCDRSLATCAARFGNAVNFRGEPHLPGLDLLTRYPGA